MGSDPVIISGSADPTAGAKEDYGDKGATLRFICQNGVPSEARVYLVKDISNTPVITADMLVALGWGEKNNCKGNVLIGKFDGKQKNERKTGKKKKHRK